MGFELEFMKRGSPPPDGKKKPTEAERVAFAKKMVALLEQTKEEPPAPENP